MEAARQEADGKAAGGLTGRPGRGDWRFDNGVRIVLLRAVMHTHLKLIA